MKQQRSPSPTIRSFFAVGCLVALGANAQAAIVDLGTPGNAANWKITGAGAVDANAFQVNANGPGEISITSDSTAAGTFVTGASLANFNGFFAADNTFVIPANATNARLDFDGLFGNDRVVLQLNGIDIGNSTFFGTAGLGLMKFGQNTSDLSYNFTETNSASITSGFIIGGPNNLRLVVNNHGFIAIDTPTQTFSFQNDGVTTRVNATLLFTTIPEPSSIALLMLGTICMARNRSRS